MLGIVVIIAAGWISWRNPTVLLVVALASLSATVLRRRLGRYDWGLHHSQLLLALTVNALRFGPPAHLYWPVAAASCRWHRTMTVGS